ncbi:hypothetical protein EAG14_11615 [Acidovorax sp. 1608163]|uniref:hypothetical protein n=1 Tax=Acidovorax sp. 1608163 TaxID=2478662 RepID=UPI000EF722C1|nr:hypothetical protein [Acidovorax sp. 1608163]AYM96602.1 hypothetical protein EAG14_11615 [Acidovorax sp. 1608163]
MQLFVLLPSLGYLATPQAEMSTFASVFALKLAVIAVLGSLFFGLRLLLNWIHDKTKGGPHPALVKLWGL